MIDLAAVAEGFALFKSATDGIRGLFGIWKDAREALPEAKQEQITRALEQSEKQLLIAEATIAQGLGYTLCKCAFPPVPMLTVGWIERGENRPVHRCPQCGITDNGGTGWTPTEEIKKRHE